MHIFLSNKDVLYQSEEKQFLSYAQDILIDIWNFSWGIQLMIHAKHHFELIVSLGGKVKRG